MPSFVLSVRITNRNPKGRLVDVARYLQNRGAHITSVNFTVAEAGQPPTPVVLTKITYDAPEQIKCDPSTW